MPTYPLLPGGVDPPEDYPVGDPSPAAGFRLDPTAAPPSGYDGDLMLLETGVDAVLLETGVDRILLEA